MSLGLQIAIWKVSDNASFVEYSYETRGSGEGLVRVNRSTGEVVLVRPSAGDGEGLLFSRVAYKLKKHWDAGELPESTHWAS
jgi:hypothetical protein